MTEDDLAPVPGEPMVEDPWILAEEEKEPEPVRLAPPPAPDERFADPAPPERGAISYGEADLTPDEISRFPSAGGDVYDEIARLLRTVVQSELEGFVRLVTRGSRPR